jgi:hypothetical protein
MAAVTGYCSKLLLDYVLLGASPVRPSNNSVGLSVGTPTSAAASEIGTGSGYARQNPGFGAADTAGQSASNASAMTFGPFSAGCTVAALQIWNTNASTGGSHMLFGQLATARTLGAGDSLVINAGALVCTMS